MEVKGPAPMPKLLQKRQDKPPQNVFLLPVLSLTPSHSRHSGPGYSQVIFPMRFSKYSNAQQLLESLDFCHSPLTIMLG